MPRPIQALVNPRAIENNVLQIKRLNPLAACFPVVKANGYGHGLSFILHGLKNCEGLAILELEGALQLRTWGWLKPIVLLEGCFDASDIQIALQHQCDWVVHNAAQLQWLENAVDQLAQANYKPTIYLKLNTGMNRLGFNLDQAPVAISKLQNLVQSLGLPTPVLMTHFANADAADLTHPTVSVFQQHDALMKWLPPTWKTSLGNSAACLNCPDLAGDIVRPGVAIYGATPGPHTAQHYGLKAAMHLESKIIAIQHVQPGDTVGYGSCYKVTKPGFIGVVACGYADGYPRHAPDGTPVMVNGIRTELVGRVSMDMLAVDLTALPDVQPGSCVQLWGDLLPVDEVAMYCGTIGYELMCAVSARVPFVVSAF